MDYILLLNRLLPNAKYQGVWGSRTFEWLDSRPKPTQEEFDKEYKIVMILKGIEDNNKQAKDELDKELAKGYLHTDGNTYICDRAGVIDIALILILVNLGQNEPIVLLTKDGKIVNITANEFKSLLTKVGQHYYRLLQEYWKKLL